jgi:hypothetical protein
MRTIPTLAAIAATLALSACASSKPVPGPSGQSAYSVRCPAAAIEKCYEEAGRLCPKGYDLADRGSGGASVLVPVGGVLVAARGPNTLLVECKT